MGLEHGGKKTTAVLTQNQDLPPLQIWQFPLIFCLKTRGSNTLLWEGGGFSEPCETPSRPADAGRLDGPASAFPVQRRGDHSSYRSRTPKRPGAPLPNPRCRSHPCPTTSTRGSSSRQLHTNRAAGIFPTAPTSSLKAGCLAELPFPQINTHSLTPKREAPRWECSGRLLSKNPALIFVPFAGGTLPGWTAPQAGSDGQSTPRAMRGPQHKQARILLITPFVASYQVWLTGKAVFLKL